MEIVEIKDRSKELVAELLTVWEGSVRATHLFLSNEEILTIKNYVPEALLGIEHLVVAKDDAGHALAFMGIQNTHLELLFVAEAARGKSIGKKLLSLGIDSYGVVDLAVNEQNPKAKGFYEHMGFEVYKRSETDEQGQPYPILYMKRN